MACRPQSPRLVPPAWPACTRRWAVLGHGPVPLPPDQSHALVSALLPLVGRVSKRRCEAAAVPREAKTAQTRETERRALAHLCTRVPSIRPWLALLLLPAAAAAGGLRGRAERISTLRCTCASPATVLGVRHTSAPLRSRVSRRLASLPRCTAACGMALA